VTAAFQHLRPSLLDAQAYAIRRRPEIGGTAAAARAKAAADYAEERRQRERA
jgi:hypothetical protein